MPNLFEDGSAGVSATGSSTVLSATQATAYHAALNVAAADRTSTEQAIVDAGDEILAAVSASWNATQQAVAADVMAFATSLQADLQRTVRKNINRGWSEGALSEMFSVITARLVTMERSLLEALARLDASPY